MRKASLLWVAMTFSNCLSSRAVMFIIVSSRPRCVLMCSMEPDDYIYAYRILDV